MIREKATVATPAAAAIPVPAGDALAPAASCSLEAARAGEQCEASQ